MDSKTNVSLRINTRLRELANIERINLSQLLETALKAIIKEKSDPEEIIRKRRTELELELEKTNIKLKQLQQKKLGESKKWQEIEIDPVLRSKIKTG